MFSNNAILAREAVGFHLFPGTELDRIGKEVQISDTIIIKIVFILEACSDCVGAMRGGLI
ncbi:MAG: hypothetical protein AB7D27_08950 [Desulfomicrobium sp.]